MKILILGANGRMGRHVVKALGDKHTLRLTDVIDLNETPQEYFENYGLRLPNITDLEGTPHEYYKLDSSDLDQVMSAAEGMDAIINLSVIRSDRQRAFDVSARGCYNAMAAAVEHGIRRVINTGPYFAVAGPSTYERFDYQLGPDVPPQPGTGIYALTKSLGLEICRVFSENHDVHVITLLFYILCYPDERTIEPHYRIPFIVAWSDAAAAFKSAIAIDFQRLPSRCEVFNISADIPHQKFSNEKAKRILDWRPEHLLEQFWRRSLV